MCIHGRQQHQCRTCGGHSFCLHSKQKDKCRICNFEGYIRQILYSRIYASLKKFEVGSIFDNLGCSTDEFIFYMDGLLNQQTVPVDREKMTWDNYAIIWEFDHIVPIFYYENSTKNLTLETIIERLHYKNIQPLYIDLNQKKRNNLQ